MYRINSEVLFHIAESLQWLSTRKPWGIGDQILRDPLKAEIRGYVTGLAESCQSMGLHMSTMQAERLEATLSGPDLYWSLFEQLRLEVRNRIFDELQFTPVFVVAPERAHLIAEPAPFGQQVADRFPSATYDVEEAAMCFAFGRNTAGVFHLMRVAEGGLKALSKALGVTAQVTGPQANWGTTLRLTGEAIQAKNKSGDPDWTPAKRSFFEGLHAHLSTVKNAWRNPAMHLEHRYHDDEAAADVLTAVRAFIRQTAKHLDENGTYHA